MVAVIAARADAINWVAEISSRGRRRACEAAGRCSASVR
ncbi:MAG: hypothetical protein QOJ37_4320 [Pseudonocardiales bacterium]|nr:hypothetical protein [Pseudonocardiales bacterium]